MTDADLREQVRSRGIEILASDLTPRERARLAGLTDDHGLDVTASLVTSFRLGKVLALLPLTRVLLGDDRLVRELRLFWADHPPTSFYAVDESLAFCQHLQQRRRSNRLRDVYLDDTVAYERAILELRKPRPAGERPPPQLVRFRHDPARLLTCLGEGRRPRTIPKLDCMFTGTVAEDGTIDWIVAGEQFAVGA